MADVFTRAKRSEVMRRIRSKDTTPERILRKGLHRLGLRYRLHATHLPGRPDLVFRKYRAVVNVRGCFWHRHTCSDGHLPKARPHYWVPKLQATQARDRRNDTALRKLGWKVIVVWECRLRNRSMLQIQLRRIHRLLTGRSAS